MRVITLHPDYAVNVRDKLLSSFPRKRESIAPGRAERGEITPNWYNQERY
jgi:hypothetical protein